MEEHNINIFKAIWTALLSLVAFGIAYILLYLIVGGILVILLNVPIINALVKYVFYIRGDSPDLMLSLMCPGIAYTLTMALQESINKNVPTRGLSCIICGVILLLLHIFSFAINLISGAGIIKNIVQAIVGFIILSKGVSDIRQ